MIRQRSVQTWLTASSPGAWSPLRPAGRSAAVGGLGTYALSRLPPPSSHFRWRAFSVVTVVVRGRAPRLLLRDRRLEVLEHVGRLVDRHEPQGRRRDRVPASRWCGQSHVTGGQLGPAGIPHAWTIRRSSREADAARTALRGRRDRRARARRGALCRPGASWSVREGGGRFPLIADLFTLSGVSGWRGSSRGTARSSMGMPGCCGSGHYPEGQGVGEEVTGDWRSGSCRPLPVREPSAEGGFVRRLAHGQGPKPQERTAGRMCGRMCGAVLRRHTRWAA